MSKALIEKTKTEMTALLHKSEEFRKKADSLSPEDEAGWDAVMVDVDKKSALLERLEKHEKLDSFMKAVPDEVIVVDPDTGKIEAKGQDVACTKAFNAFLNNGLKGVNTEGVEAIQKGSVIMHPNASVALKGMAIGDPIDGGYLVAPMQFVNELIKELNALMAIREMSRTFTVTDASSLGVPNMDTDLDDFDWTSEIDSGSLDDIEIGKRAMTPHPLAKRVQISKTLLRKAMMDPEALVRERAVYKLSRTQEKAFMTGDGAQKPLGVFTASTDGIPTTRDTTSAVAGIIDGDDIIDCVSDLETQYLSRAIWLLHRKWLAYIRKLKDDAGNYIWTPFDMQGKAMVGANPGTILGIPYRLSEDAPSTVSAGNYAAILGDFNYYWIVDSLNMQVQVLTEIEARANKNEYHFRSETDAAPVLKQAFRRLKMHA